MTATAAELRQRRAEIRVVCAAIDEIAARYQPDPVVLATCMAIRAGQLLHRSTSPEERPQVVSSVTSSLTNAATYGHARPEEREKT